MVNKISEVAEAKREEAEDSDVWEEVLVRGGDQLDKYG